MNSLKCASCRLVYIDRGQLCPRCGEFNQPEADQPEEARGSRGAVVTLACVLLLVAVGVVYYLMPPRQPAYAKAIRTSELFKQLATVRINQNPLNPPNGSLPSKMSNNTLSMVEGVTLAAYVLEARGLYSIDHKTTVARVPPLQQYQMRSHMEPGGVVREYAVPYTVKEGYEWKNRYLIVGLTPAGEQEAKGWSETEEAYGGKPKVPFWRVPVGEAEFVKVDQVLNGPGKGEVGMMTVEVLWLWRPNAFGQTFDKSGVAFGLLPDGARDAATRLGFDSSAELKAWVDVEPTEGGGWRVLSVKPMYEVPGDFIEVD